MTRKIKINIDYYDDDNTDDNGYDYKAPTLDAVVKALMHEYNVETFMNGILVE